MATAEFNLYVGILLGGVMAGVMLPVLRRKFQSKTAVASSLLFLLGFTIAGSLAYLNSAYLGGDEVLGGGLIEE